ncbi:MAG: hypothetical protein B6I17_04635 [Tenericutes bacterium 4572_104]|nr:MAG: hypothetical protein B6I17_04635 [Tenericutes bacterium 4572_104]
MKTQISLLNKTVNRIGFWSAILTTVWVVWFIVAFGSYMSSLPSEWPGIAAFAASFEPIPYIAWVVPCLLLALTFPAMMSCIHYYASDNKRIWSLLGLVFAVMYGAVLAANYWVLLTLVRESLLGGYTEGLEWFVIGSPHSITNTIEGIGYGFMGLAAVFVSQVFDGDKLKNWLRWLFIVNGVAGIAGVILGGLGIIMATMVSLALWCITFPVATAMVAVLFKRASRVTA